jgi:diguanylate cyclase (GGDEF)-like protein
MNERKRLLIAAGDEAVRAWFERFLLHHKDLEGEVLLDAHGAVQRIAATKPQAFLLDMPPTAVFDINIFNEIRAVDPSMPIIALLDAGDANRLQSLRHGAYSSIEKPMRESEEVYCIICNAVGAYRERRELALAVSEMKDRCEADRLNLLELDLVKGLQHMIGETEEPASIFKHSFSLIKNYLAFEAFAALVPRHEEAEIYIYPNVALSEDIGETITGTLIKRMARLAEEDKKVKVVVEEKSAERLPSDGLKYLVVPLVTTNRTWGYAGIYRGAPFDYTEESVFKRFCAHMATTLEKISLFEEIKSLSVSDGLTGLHNHLSIVSKLEQEVRRSERYGSLLSVIIFDIDNFKEVNDTFGHLAGDAVLVELARMVSTGVRSIDSVGRYGGEEFLIILPETDGKGAAAIGDRLRQKVAETSISYNRKAIFVSISGGVASYREGRDAGKLIGLADANLYKAKSEGKNMVRYDED